MKLLKVRPDLDDQTKHVLLMHSGVFKKYIGQYKRSAKRRGYEWSISPLLFYNVITHNCVYCNNPPTKLLEHHKKGRSSKMKVNGMDRVNNQYGYHPANVETCCSVCNYRKGNMDRQEFERWILSVSKNAHKNQEWNERVCKPRGLNMVKDFPNSNVELYVSTMLNVIKAEVHYQLIHPYIVRPQRPEFHPEFYKIYGQLKKFNNPDQLKSVAA